METVTYLSGGLLGDFIHNLSIVNETYLKTGKKGIVYIRNVPVYFRLGVERAYKDTFPIVSKQPYIHEYKIYNGEPYDINLDRWRESHLLYKASLYEIYKATYDVEWATHPWLLCNGLINDTFKDTVFVSCSTHRFPLNVDFKELFEQVGFERVQFITQTLSEYTGFKERTGIDIPLYLPSSLEDMVGAIQNCALFIGNMSSPLTYAYALHKKNITLHNFHTWEGDDVFFKGLDTVLPNIRFNP